VSAHPTRRKPPLRRWFPAVAAAVFGLVLVAPAGGAAFWSFSGASTEGSQPAIDSGPAGAPPDARAPTARPTPNVLVIETDDQTLKSMRVMSNVNSLIGDQGVTFQNSFPNPPHDCESTAKPAPRHAHSFDSESLPKPPNFSEPYVSDKPAAIRNLPLLTADQVTNIQRKYRCELESLLSVDEGVKKVVEALAANGELDNTLIVYTSDNGFFHGEHRIPQGKERIYEESIRVLLQMRGPGIPPGEKVSDLSINALMDERSLIPVAQNPGIESGRELLVEEPFGGARGFDAIRTERYMYAEHSMGEKELYDLQKGPFELQSRQADASYASVKAQLVDDLHQLQNCAGATCLLHSP
jgi:arylsulfatase A-like enzyme